MSQPFKQAAMTTPAASTKRQQMLHSDELVNKLSHDNKNIFLTYIRMYACTYTQTFSIVRFLFSPTNGGCTETEQQSTQVTIPLHSVVTYTASALPLTAPISMSYMSVPRLHQSTALPWPVLWSISGALGGGGKGKEGR